MALTRAMLKGMNLTDEQVSAIIEEHTSVTDELVKERDKFKKEAGELPNVQKQLDDLTKEYEDFKKANEGNDGWQKKYDDEHKAFEDYKAEIAGKESAAKLRDAYKKLLVECKVGEKQIDSVLKVTDFKDMKLQEDGTLENADKLKEQINSDWSGFITSTGSKGTDPKTPPEGNGKGGEGGKSHAAELAQRYRENLYGKEE